MKRKLVRISRTKCKVLPPPPINPLRAGTISILAIEQNHRNGWRGFPTGVGDPEHTFRDMKWTNEDGTIYPDDYKDPN